jgi:hypothetical protein
MEVTGDSTVANGLATIAFDDDGVFSQQWVNFAFTTLTHEYAMNFLTSSPP